jgi:hypothetical protein
MFTSKLPSPYCNLLMFPIASTIQAIFNARLDVLTDVSMVMMIFWVAIRCTHFREIESAQHHNPEEYNYQSVMYLQLLHI